MTKQQLPVPQIQDRRGIDPSWDAERPLQFSPDFGGYDPYRRFAEQTGELLEGFGLSDSEVGRTTLVLDNRTPRSFYQNTQDVLMDPSHGSENADGSFSILADGILWSSRKPEGGFTQDQIASASIVEVLSHAASRVIEQRAAAKRAEQRAWREFARDELTWTQRHPRAAGAAATTTIVAYAAALAPALIVPAVLADRTFVQPQYERLEEERLSARELWRRTVWLPQRRSEWAETALEDRRRYLGGQIGHVANEPLVKVVG